MTIDYNRDLSHWQQFKEHVASGRESLAAYRVSGVEWFRKQSAVKKTLVCFGLLVLFIGFVLLVVFHVYLVKLLVLLSDKLRELPYGSVLLFALVFIVGFPPLIGFSALAILSGMTYGMLPGWCLLASASITGSFASFLLFRYVLRSRAEGLMQANEKFRAFGDILRQDSSIFILILIRLCPLPYSLSNGALAAVPELSVGTYFLASVITSPKLFLHVFVGHQIKDINEDHKPAAAKIVDVVSLLITSIASALTAYIIYNKMQRMIQKYHALDGEQYGDVVFGNFEELESGNTLELSSADYDEDNFIIEDEDEDLEPIIDSNEASPSPHMPSHYHENVDAKNNGNDKDEVNDLDRRTYL